MYQDSFAPGDLRAEAMAAVANFEKPATSWLARTFSAFVSIALLVAVALAVRHLDLARVMALIPRKPLFWMVFAACYLVQPIADWVIYRRLWQLPASGIAALLRKVVSNELLLGYLGEVQFYAWARGRLNLVAAPFGAIKDVTILSALTGNIATLIMVAVAYLAGTMQSLVAAGMLGRDTKQVFWSLAVVLTISFVILLFRQKLFSLPRAKLVFITIVHFVRIITYVGLTALMWHIAMPDVDIGLWLMLATLRMLVSRLPLVPNKDVVFAGVSVFLLGHEAEIASLMAMMAGLSLVTHIGVGAIFATSDVVGTRGRRV